MSGSIGGTGRAASPRGLSFPDFDSDGFNLLCLSPPTGERSRGPASPSAWWKSKVA